MMTMTTIKIPDYAPAPGGRFVKDGKYSGEWFRDDVLKPFLSSALAHDDVVVVDLAGAPGYGSSFLEEAFGGLIRKGYFSHAQLTKHLSVRAGTALYEPYKKLVSKYIETAKKES